MKREGKEDKDGNRKVAGPPVDAHLQPPADRVAIQHDAQEPARRKHPRDTLLRSASKASSSAWLVFSPPVCRRPPVDRAHAAPVRPTELARPLRQLPLDLPLPLLRRPDYDGGLLRKRLARRGGRLLRRVLLRSAHLPLLPQNRSTVTAVLSTRHLARYSPNGLRHATRQGAGGRLDRPR